MDLYVRPAGLLSQAKKCTCTVDPVIQGARPSKQVAQEFARTAQGAVRDVVERLHARAAIDKTDLEVVLEVLPHARKVCRNANAMPGQKVGRTYS